MLVVRGGLRRRTLFNSGPHPADDDRLADLICIVCSETIYRTLNVQIESKFIIKITKLFHGILIFSEMRLVIYDK